MTLDGKLECWTAGEKKDGRKTMIEQYTNYGELGEVRFTYKVSPDEKTEITYTAKMEDFEWVFCPFIALGDLKVLVSLTVKTEQERVVKRRHFRLFPPKIETAFEEVTDVQESRYYGRFNDKGNPKKNSVISGGELIDRIRKIYTTEISEKSGLNHDFVASLFEPIEDKILEFYSGRLGRQVQSAREESQEYFRRKVK